MLPAVSVVEGKSLSLRDTAAQTPAFEARLTAGKSAAFFGDFARVRQDRCAPVYFFRSALSRTGGVRAAGPEEGLKHPSWIAPDGWVSIPQSRLTGFVASLSCAKVARLSQVLKIALDI